VELQRDGALKSTFSTGARPLTPDSLKKNQSDQLLLGSSFSVLTLNVPEGFSKVAASTPLPLSKSESRTTGATEAEEELEDENDSELDENEDEEDEDEENEEDEDDDENEDEEDEDEENEEDEDDDENEDENVCSRMASASCSVTSSVLAITISSNLEALQSA
jgi:hypothetical protein